MYVYDLEISMSKKNIPITAELVDAIKEAINLSNKSFSATRYGRSIQYIDQIDDYRIHLQMQSKDPLNATRSLSSLSRALVKNENEKNSHILDKYVYNGSVFISKNLGVNEESSTYISDTEMVQEIISMVFNQGSMNNRDKQLSRDYTEKLRNLILDYQNNKTI